MAKFTSKFSPYKVRLLAYLLTFSAFALRLYRIDNQSLWLDEGWSIYLTRQSLSEMIYLVPSALHPPLYYTLLHFWEIFAGFSGTSVRFLSLLFGVLLVPLLFRATRKLFDLETALVAAAIVTLSPLHITYSQEARMYSLFMLEYAAILYLLYLFVNSNWRLSWDSLGLLALFEVMSLYTHYFSFFIVAYLNGSVILSLLAHRRFVELRNWLGTQVLVGLSYLPWVFAFVRQLQLVGRLGLVGTERVTPSSLAHLMSWTWQLLNSGPIPLGQTHALFNAWLTLLAVVLAIFLDHKRRQSISIILHMVGPLMFFLLALCLLGAPFLHPRYLIWLSIPFFILIGRTISVLSDADLVRQTIGGLLALTIVLTFITAVGAFYYDYHKGNVRSMANYLEEVTNSNSVIIFDYVDYAFDYYYRGPGAVHYIQTLTDESQRYRPGLQLELWDWKEEPQAAARLEELRRGKQDMVVVRRFGGEVDQRNLLPFFSELGGKLVERRFFHGYEVQIYELEEPVAFPKLETLYADYGVLRLTGAFYQPMVPANEAIGLALRWRLAKPTDKEYKVRAVVWDERGRYISSTDVFLLNPRMLTTDKWEVGEEATNYYILPIPLGTPPLPYRITVGVYDAATMKSLSFLDAAGNPAGEAFFLGEVRLTKARDFERDPYGTRQYLHLETLDEPLIADGLALEGFAVGKARPARTVSVTLRWRALREGLPRYVPRLRLRLGDAILAEVGSALFEERYPTTEWAQGEVVFEQRDLIYYPPKAGRAVLEVEVEGKIIPLTELELERAELLFEAPPMQHEVGVRFGEFAELLGYDLDGTEATTDEKVRLTLYWRAINEKPLATGYTVFTHLLSEEGRLIGQHDGIPAGGERPTTSWVPGEVIVDVHEMEFSDLGYRGKALIEVGLYESLTIERVLTGDGRDHIILPTEVMVEPAQR